MKMRGKNSGIVQPPVLILADFSDGSWHAISFAMQFLHSKKSPLAILQTYQKPNFGLFMLRNLLPHLKEITKNELNALKKRLLKNYKIKAENIKTFSFRGKLTRILQQKPMLNEPNSIVLGTHGSFADSCTMQNQCLAEIVNTSNTPLFILPQQFESKKQNKILFVGNPLKVPSQQITNKIVDICAQTKSELNILFVANGPNRKMNEEVSNYLKTHLNEINYSINYTQNETIWGGMESFLKNKPNDLIIVERTGKFTQSVENI